MTKQEILNMNTSRDIMKALSEHRGLWDQELNEHLRCVKRLENERRFGDADAIFTPARRNNTD